MGVKTTPPLPEITFFVIGASRSGTNTLRHYLRAHPDVCLPTGLDEPRFFAFEGDPLDYTGPGDDLLGSELVTDPAAYAALFEGVRAEAAIGEVTPAYLCSTVAASRIWTHFPAAKIVAILRHPVHRAISSFRRERLAGLEPASTLEEALELEDTRRRSGWCYAWRYRYRGLYYTHLSRYFRLFPADQIKVLRYEDWERDHGRALLREVFAFIGVDPEAALPERSVRLNAAREQQFAARGLPPVAQQSEPVLEELLEHYRPEITRLQEVTGLALSDWLDPAAVKGSG